MTKKELILEKSLRLFSTNGFKGTSTRSIANEAGVSEGLIFKHFRNKNGLLIALLKIGASKSNPEIQKIKSYEDPKSVISSCIRLFLKIKKEDYPYWRLYYANGFEESSQTIGLEPLLKKVIMNAFKKMGHAKTELETELLLNSLDGLMIKMITSYDYDVESQVTLILKKYRLN
jgi:AcrR family transcriptional regulator